MIARVGEKKVSELGEQIGIVLSSPNTREASCQLLESAERGGIREGMMLVISTDAGARTILCTVAEIVPYHAFYTEGASWSEAIRKKLPLPEGVARQYEVCKLDILMQIPGAKEVNIPPHPADPVYRIDPERQVEQIFAVKKDDKGIVWYGTLAGYQKAPVPLNVESIPMHFAVFGITGRGKSFDMGVLIEKLCNIPAGKERLYISFPMIIVDAHGDYVNYASYLNEHLKPHTPYRSKPRTGTRPFTNPLGAVTQITRYVFQQCYRTLGPKEKEYTQQIAIDLNKLSDRDLAELIVTYYKGQIGPEQELQIYGIESSLSAVRELGYPWGESKNEIFVNPDYFDQFRRHVQATPGLFPQTVRAIGNALEKFRRIDEKFHIFSEPSSLKSDQFIDDLTSHGSVAIIDFSADGAPGVDLPEKQLVVSYLATLLFNRFTSYRIEKKPRFLLFAIEECQNFCPNPNYPVAVSIAKNKLSAIATQGRKFGLSLCLISQRPSFVDPVILSMCNTFFIHGISPEDVGFVKSVTGGLPPALASRLTRLAQGELIVTGQMCKVPFPVVIRVKREERIVEHPTGKTDVVDRLTELRE
jgi:hypothetical protein